MARHFLRERSDTFIALFSSPASIRLTFSFLSAERRSQLLSARYKGTQPPPPLFKKKLRGFTFSGDI